MERAKKKKKPDMLWSANWWERPIFKKKEKKDEKKTRKKTGRKKREESLVCSNCGGVPKKDLPQGKEEGKQQERMGFVSGPSPSKKGEGEMNGPTI